MFDSTNSALGGLVIALSGLRAADQLFQLARKYLPRKVRTADSGAVLSTASGAATIGYALVIGADRTLLISACITTASSAATWLMPVPIRLDPGIKMPAAAADKSEAGDA